MATRAGANDPVFFLHPFLVGAEKRFSFGCKFPGIVYLFEITDSRKLFIEEKDWVMLVLDRFWMFLDIYS